MAGKKIKGLTQLEGSTLLEVILAMVIIMVVFSMAMGIIGNVQSNAISLQKMKLSALLQKERIRSEEMHDTLSETLHLQGFRIEKKWEMVPNHPHCWLLNLRGYDPNQTLVKEINVLEYETSR